MRSRLGAAVLAAGLILTLTAEGCESEGKNRPGHLAATSTNYITRGMAGSWSAPGGPNCTWKKTYKNKQGVTISLDKGSGRGRQNVLFFTSDVGHKFTTRGCGQWK